MQVAIHGHFDKLEMEHLLSDKDAIRVILGFLTVQEYKRDRTSEPDFTEMIVLSSGVSPLPWSTDRPAMHSFFQLDPKCTWIKFYQIACPDVRVGYAHATNL